MSTSLRTRLETFTETDLPDLDEVVLGALEYLNTVEFPELDVHLHKQPLVVGSGNALQTGKLLFRDTNARFAEESGALKTLSEISFDSLYIISASGSKHAIMLAQKGVASGLPTYLITTNGESPAAAIVGHDMTAVFPHIREPYTYNTSTYLSMLFGTREESPALIAEFIQENVVPTLNLDFSRFNSYLLTVPAEFKAVRKMFETKFDELFGPYVHGRTYTLEEVKHAKTVVTGKEQCFISFGEDQVIGGSPGGRLTIPLPSHYGPAALIAIGYYVIGCIQKAHHPYFKESITAYTKEASQFFGHEIAVIVE